MRGARRGFLGLLGGGGASALMGAGGRGAAIRGPGPAPMAMAYAAQMGDMARSADPERDRKWSLLRELRRPRERAQRRAEIQRALTGGWPPGIACMESNAVWFRAALAARRIEAEMDAHEDWFAALQRRVLGEGLG